VPISDRIRLKIDRVIVLDPVMRDWKAIVARNVRKLRQQRKLTQEQLAFRQPDDADADGELRQALNFHPARQSDRFERLHADPQRLQAFLKIAFAAREGLDAVHRKAPPMTACLPLTDPACEASVSPRPLPSHWTGGKRQTPRRGCMAAWTGTSCTICRWALPSQMKTRRMVLASEPEPTGPIGCMLT